MEGLIYSFRAFPANLLVSVAMLLQLKVLIFEELSGIKPSVLLVYLIWSSES
jgi:hypothetical protein